MIDSLQINLKCLDQQYHLHWSAYEQCDKSIDSLSYLTSSLKGRGRSNLTQLKDSMQNMSIFHLNEACRLDNERQKVEKFILHFRYH